MPNKNNKIKIIILKGILTGQILNLFFNDYKFKFS